MDLTSVNPARDILMREDSNKVLEITVTALSALTGITLWQKSFSVQKPPTKISLLNDTENLGVLTENGFYYLIGKQNGNLIVEKKLGYNIATIPLRRGEKIYFGTFDKKIVILSAHKGNLVSEAIVKSIPTIIMPSDNDLVYFGDNIGLIQAIGEKTKKIHWSTVTGAGITDITIVSEGLLVSSNDNYIYLLSAKNGNRIWKRRLAGRSFGKPLIRDRIGVFSSYGSNEAAFLDLRKGKIVNQVFIADGNYFVGSPTAGVEGISVIFPTLKGLYAFGYGGNCQSVK